MGIWGRVCIKLYIGHVYQAYRNGLSILAVGIGGRGVIYARRAGGDGKMTICRRFQLK